MAQYPYAFNCPQCGYEMQVTSCAYCPTCQKGYFGGELPDGPADCLPIGRMVIEKSEESA